MGLVIYTGVGNPRNPGNQGTLVATLAGRLRKEAAISSPKTTPAMVLAYTIAKAGGGLLTIRLQEMETTMEVT